MKIGLVWVGEVFPEKQVGIECDEMSRHDPGSSDIGIAHMKLRGLGVARLNAGSRKQGGQPGTALACVVGEFLARRSRNQRVTLN